MDYEIELDWLKKWSLHAPQRIALTDGFSGQNISYLEFYQQATSMAEVLRTKFQIQAGDRVALLAQNELTSIVLFFALQRVGAILVPVNFRLTNRELDYIFKDCEPKLILLSEEFESVQEQIHFKEIKPIYCLLKSDSKESLEGLTLKNVKKFTEFRGSFEDPILLLYTSGTTGFPKGAVLNHRSLFWNSISTALRLNVNQNDSAVIFLPLFHTGGWNVLTTPFLHHGARIILIKKFDAHQVLKISSDQKCTLLFGVPTTMDIMSKTDTFSDVDLSCLRYAIVGGEPMPVELIKTWHQKGVTIRQGYGLTEFGPNVFSLNEQDSIRKIGSIGFPNFYIEIKVVNQKGELCQPDEIGELALRGPAMMLGYWKNPQATAETIRQGWLYTGDLVRIDVEGYAYVVGRRKEMYISGAENVYPAEIEQVLYQHQAISEAAVIGVPDEKWGEVGKAFVALKKSAQADRNNDDILSEIKSHCLSHLAKYKVPKYFVLIDELPKSESGKILKRQLAQINK